MITVLVDWRRLNALTAPGVENGTTIFGLDPGTLGSIRIEVQRSITSPKPKLGRSRPKNRPAGNSGTFHSGSQEVLKIDEILSKPEHGGLTHSTK